MVIAMVALAAYLTGIVYSSFFEWTLHKYVMHRPFLGLRYPFRAHAQVHHQVFNYDETYLLQRREDARIVAMAWWNGPAIILINSPVWFSAGMIAGMFQGALFGSFFWAATIGGGMSMVTYYIMYESLHWCMHTPNKRWFSQMGWFRWIDDHHRMHHKRPMTNLNVVLPIADLVLRSMAPGLPPVSRMAEEARETAKVG